MEMLREEKYSTRLSYVVNVVRKKLRLSMFLYVTPPPPAKELFY